MDDIYLEVARAMSTNIKERDVAFNIWGLYPTPSIVDKFANKDAFCEMSDYEVKQLIIEMNNRVAKSLGMPASNITFADIDLDKGGFSGGIGKTFANGGIEIGFVGKDNFGRLPEFRQQWLGLEYLNTIIHESRHAYQHYMASQYFGGKHVNRLMACIAQDNFIEMASTAKDIDFSTDYDTSLCEYDAVGFAYSVLSKYAKYSDYEDEIEDYLNKECACILADSKDKKDIVREHIKTHKANLTHFKKNFSGDNAQKFAEIFDMVDLESVADTLQKDYNRYKTLLLDYLNSKVDFYGQIDRVYADKIAEYINNDDLYKAYYGVLYVKEQLKNKSENKGEEYEITK